MRGIFRDASNIRFLLGEVSTSTRTLSITIRAKTQVRVEPYDYLILATGSQTHTFGVRLRNTASAEDACRRRNAYHVLKNFEKAAWSTVRRARSPHQIVVVGGVRPG